MIKLLLLAALAVLLYRSYLGYVEAKRVSEKSGLNVDKKVLVKAGLAFGFTNFSAFKPG